MLHAMTWRRRPVAGIIALRGIIRSLLLLLLLCLVMWRRLVLVLVVLVRGAL